VRTIVARLLANAADVTPPGREIVLSVLHNTSERIALLTVSDVGRGVPAAELPRVFSANLWEERVPGWARCRRAGDGQEPRRVARGTDLGGESTRGRDYFLRSAPVAGARIAAGVGQTGNFEAVVGVFL
jgi:hypothetical protein